MTQAQDNKEKNKTGQTPETEDDNTNTTESRFMYTDPVLDLYCEFKMPLDSKRAHVEASRCYYCYDAPCIQACPTQIDIPGFIRKISTGNPKGAAMDILSANILGGTCARACPVETLCQQACVRETSEKKPVEIGRLQRYATDHLMQEFHEQKQSPFEREPDLGKKIAVIGAGPAGLSCAHSLAQKGYSVTIFEARSKGAGLNEYGLAAYKMLDDFAQNELEFVLSVGGIEVCYDTPLSATASKGCVTLESLLKSHQAVFLGLGLGHNKSLGIPGEDLQGVYSATEYIARIRQSKNVSHLNPGKNAVVIGGGNTAIDIAVQVKRLGAESVTLVYRRGKDQMGATPHEQEFALTQGVKIVTWAKPVKILNLPTPASPSGGSASQKPGVAGSIEFEKTTLSGQAPNGKLVGTGELFTLEADRIYKAVGQQAESSLLSQLSVGEHSLSFQGRKLNVDERFETPIPFVFAGGDLIDAGEDLTVTAVQHGKLAAQCIHERLQNSPGHKESKTEKSVKDSKNKGALNG